VKADASMKGWGFHSEHLGVNYGEQWDELVSADTNIELRALRRMLQHLTDKLKGKHERVYTDNTTTVACTRKGGSARSKTCQAETEEIDQICRGIISGYQSATAQG
jgi:hypothetical protein